MHLISQTDELKQAVERLSQGDFVTVDTEFLRESTFWPKLCLIQMAAPGAEYLIDSLAEGLDLAPFYELMANERIVKVFHAARQDVEIVHHLADVIPRPLFDTQAAAMVCGFGDSIAYDSLVRRITGHDIDKSSRFTDWSRRPLSEQQLSYALADVTHLRDVYLALARMLADNGRTHWLAEEMDVLTAESTYRQHPEDAWKRLKAKVRKPKQIAVLMEVAAWREVEAQRRDVPRSRILKDDSIHEIATQLPRDADGLGALRTIHNGFVRSAQGQDVIAAVRRGLARDPASIPVIQHPAPLPQGIAPVSDLLRVLLKKVCESEGVAQRIVASGDDLDRIAADDDADVPALTGWRRELFGKLALALKRGELALAIEHGKVVTVEHQPAQKPKPATVRPAS